MQVKITEVGACQGFLAHGAGIHSESGDSPSKGGTERGE